MSYAFGWVIYLLKLPFWLLYRLVEFISRPATRYVVPLGLAGFAALNWGTVQAFVFSYGSGGAPLYTPEEMLFTLMLALTGAWGVMVLMSSRLTFWAFLALAYAWWNYFTPNATLRVEALRFLASGSHGVQPDAILLAVLVALLAVLVAIPYTLFSWGFAVFIASAPIIRRPLPPIRALTAKNRVITPNPTGVVVPPLRRSGKPVQGYDLLAALAPEIRALMAVAPAAAPAPPIAPQADAAAIDAPDDATGEAAADAARG